MKNDNSLTSQPIPGLVRRLAVPASVGFFFNTMYNVVDTYFAGLISTRALAALSLSLPIFFIIIAMGTGLSTGATALMGNALGAGRESEAKGLALQGITFGVLTGVILTLAGLWASPFLFRVLGASEDYLDISLVYMNAIFLGSVFFMTVHMLNAILNALGDTRSYRNFLIAGVFLNVLLDPWFMYGGLGIPPLGILGIALATVVIQVLGGLYLGFRVSGTGVTAGMRLRDLLPRMGPFREIFRQGFPASLNMMTVGVGIFVITYFVGSFGEEAVAAYGIAMRVEQIVLVPTIGLNIATLALVARNNGAGLYDRVRETLHTALGYGGMLMGPGTILVFVSAGPLMGLFTPDVRVIGVGTTYLRIDAFVLYAYVILFATVAALQGIKRPMFGVWIGLYRQILAPVILFQVLTGVFDFGLTGIWWGIFSITWSAAAITILYARRILGRLPGRGPGGVFPDRGPGPG